MRFRTITTAAVASLALVSAPRALAATPVRASTGGATNVHETSALVTGKINAHEVHVSYFFRWGPTRALAFQTPILVDPKPEQPTALRVGQLISGLRPGAIYYSKLVVVLPEGTRIEEHERALTTKATRLTFNVPHRLRATFGDSFLLSGTLTGTGNAGVSVVMQASPFPYLESFTQIGPPAVTTPSGAFSFRVANLKRSTQLRMIANAPLPTFSPIVNVAVQPRVIMHVRSSSERGLDRIYGTISPAVRGAKVLVQVQKAIRPKGTSEVTEGWAAQFTTAAQKGVANSSRFSVIAKIKRKGRYRVFVQVPRGAGLASGPSTRTFVLQAFAGAGK